ncbi:MAG: ribose 5-phosphate isomerase B [Clostridiales bacterium]|nr:ribose 5-phosphate isomerase B [Clostridiales bacterium]
MLAIGGDHASPQLKEEIKKHLDEKNIAYKDFGTFSDESVDYPTYGEMVANAVASGEYEKGILICGTGVGMSMTANKVRGIRAVVCSDCYSAALSRRHNDANILALGARVVGPDLAKMIIDTWLEAEFEGGRHQNRVDLIMDVERKNFQA